MTAQGSQNLAPSTGLFSITDLQQISQYRQLVEKVQRTYNTEPSPKWTVEYKLYHARPETAKIKGGSPDSQHILHLSHARSHFFIALDKPESAATTASEASKTETGDDKPSASEADASQVTTTATATPSVSQSTNESSTQSKSEALFLVKAAESQKEATLAILSQKMALLWTPKIFLNLTGVSFKIGDSHVRIGEVRSGTSTNVRALIVAIELASVTDATGLVASDEQERVRWEVGKIREEIGLTTFAKDAWGFGSDQSVLGAWCDIMKLK